MHYEDDVRLGTPVNTVMPSQFALNGSNFNFLAIGAGIVICLLVKTILKKHSEQVFEERRKKDIQSKSFSDHMFERFAQFLLKHYKLSMKKFLFFFNSQKCL